MVVSKKAASTTTLPFDIVHSILLLLPARSLNRFKTVCKSWNALISDHDFVKNHLQRSKNSINRNILVRKSYLWCHGELRLAKFENSKHQVEEIQKHGNIGYAGELLCSSDDGLLLVRNHSPSYIMLWNPSSKQQERIPRPDEFMFELYRRTFGFCRGPTFDDYKIIAICDDKYYAVFSCKDKVWSVRKEFPYGSRNILVKRGVFVDGFTFFVMFECDRGVRNIVYFDPIDETFNMLQKPKEEENFSLTSLRGCLCLYNYRYGADGLQIWIMRDHIAVDSNSWTKYIFFDYKCAVRLRRSFMVIPLFLTEKNELVVSSHYERESEIGIYNSVEEKYEKLDVPPSKEICYSETIPYVDSLVFPIGST